MRSCAVRALRIKTNGDFATVNLTIQSLAIGPAATPGPPLYLVILEEAPFIDYEQAEQAVALQTGVVVAVLGMDIDARAWECDIAFRAALPVGLMLVLLIGKAGDLETMRTALGELQNQFERLKKAIEASTLLDATKE